jgi:hypothetical protein
MMTYTYCFDLDETLCTSKNLDYKHAVPLTTRIETVNSLFQAGNTIIIYTARGSKTGSDWSTLTENQLSSWNVSYHKLVMGKPFADFYIDDKAVLDSDFFS